MDLILIRHGEPVRIAEGETQGPADPPLNDRGRLQAGATASWLAQEPLGAVWSSPLRRAQETATYVARHHDLEVVVDDELAEYDRDATSYIPVEELRATKDDRWFAMVEGRLEDYSIDPEEFRRGVVGAVERIVAANPGGIVAVVCHGGVINAYLGHVLGIAKPLWFEPRYASINRVAASRHGERSIVSMNEAGHLRGLLGSAGSA